MGKRKRALRGFDFASYRCLGGGRPAVKLRLKMAMVQAQHSVGGGELGVWGASPESRLPFIGAGVPLVAGDAGV
jgi:hypothetical protein